MVRTSSLLLALGAIGCTQAVELTKDDWDAKTAGKSVFVKFFAPWCGHCKNMKPAWDKLMAEYDGSESVVVADVDCVGTGKSMCDSIGVQGFPTIKYGDPNNLEAYEGGRDYDALAAFAKENLGPTCGPANLDLCDAEKKKQVESFLAMPIDELKKEIEAKEADIKQAETDLEELLKSLQSQYEAGQKKRDATKNEIKESGLGLMKSVAAHRKTTRNEL